MPRAQCYYEILGISETATTEEVKKAYKKEALVWHPDKNQANPDEAHAKFQTILKAYETLSDNREREWYDRHKDQILSDGGKEAAENCLNLFQFFSSACYANFDDSEDGFYTVYRNVFEKIAEEEREAMSQVTRSRTKSKVVGGSNRNNEISTDSLPLFGDSQSSYEEIVRPFYAFWSGFCTSLTFDFKDKYNTLEAENRRIVRAMEKENKKIKDAARKERNTNVRNLVEFIKKRDKRLKAHKLMVEQQNELNRQKTAEKQRQQREKLSKEKAEYKPSAYLGMDDVEEQLRQLESEYQDELRKGKRARRRRNQIDDDDDDDNDEDNDYRGDANGDVDGDKQANGDSTSPPVANDIVISEDDNANDKNDDDDEEEEDNFYCAACNKEFRTINAFENHEASRKHKQNVQKLTKLLKADEHKLK